MTARPNAGVGKSSVTGSEIPPAESGGPPDAVSDPAQTIGTALLADLARKWGIPPMPGSVGSDRTDGFEAFVRRALAERVLHMMLHQPDRLMAALYVLDIPETAFRDAMHQGATPAEQADRLAGIILEREIRRMQTRLRYRREPMHPPMHLEQPPPEPQA